MLLSATVEKLAMLLVKSDEMKAKIIPRPWTHNNIDPLPIVNKREREGKAYMITV